MAARPEEEEEEEEEAGRRPLLENNPLIEFQEEDHKATPKFS